MKKRVFSGIRATGRLHLGNYLGAVKGMLDLQNDPSYETIYGVVDLHTLTTPYDKTQLQQSIRDIVIDYLAAGLDPQKSHLIVQSMVPEHVELAYYFSTVTTMAKMQHLPTFKDKVKQHPEHVTMALLNYPVLMAADILVYKASVVPAGLDQEPHIEVAREIARRMNLDYGTDFPEPVRIATKGTYVPSLTGEGKMSKSVEGSYINLDDDEATVQKKVRSIPTATTSGGVKTPGLQSLFTLLSLFIPERVEMFENSFKNGSLRFVELKDLVAAAISDELRPLQERRRQIAADPTYVDGVIQEGATKARAIAAQTITEVKEKMGLAK